MLEDSGQATKEIQGQDVQTSDTEESVDYKNLYLQEVQNAKKLRKRSQDAEKKVSSYDSKVEEQRIAHLKENEEYKTLADELQQKLDTVSPYKEKWETHESQTRESLLSKVPEADRKMLKDESLKTLEYIVSKQEESKPSNPRPISGQARNSNTLPSGNVFEKVPSEDVKSNWSEVLDNYKQKQKLN